MDEQTHYSAANGQYTRNGVPVGYTAITPFVVVDNPGQAISFYETVFGAKAKNITEAGDGNQKTIIHADVDFGHGYIQLGAANPAFHLVLPPGGDDACYSLGIYVPDVDRVFQLAVEHGAIVREPLANFVSGDRYGSILDPFGIRWSIMTRVEDISEEESYRRVNEWSQSM